MDLQWYYIKPFSLFLSPNPPGRHRFGIILILDIVKAQDGELKLVRVEEKGLIFIIQLPV